VSVGRSNGLSRSVIRYGRALSLQKLGEFEDADAGMEQALQLDRYLGGAGVG
jgi:hypothetical protein